MSGPDASPKIASRTVQTTRFGSLTIDEEVAVSYTHLDVYKRQGQMIGVGSPINGNG